MGVQFNSDAFAVTRYELEFSLAGFPFGNLLCLVVWNVDGDNMVVGWIINVLKA